MHVLRLDHVQLAMPAGREAEAVSFYERILGIPQVQKPPHLAARGSCWFESGAGSLGSVTHLTIDDIPLGLAVTTMMAAVPSAVIPVPLSTATLTVLIAGISPSESTPVFVAAVVALIIGRLIEATLPKPEDHATS